MTLGSKKTPLTKKEIPTKHKMPSSASKELSKRLSKVELDISEIKEILKASTKKKPKSPKSEKKHKSSNKPVKIEKSKNIEELRKFTVSELKDYIKKKKIDIKKISDKHKEDFVKIVWKYIKDSSDSETDSRNYSSEYDSDSGTDSDCSDSDSDSDSD